MIDVVVFGELPIATKIVQYLESLDGVRVPCVVCENYDANNADPWLDVPMLFQYAKDVGIQVLSLSELQAFLQNSNLKPVVGVTARFSRILRKNHLMLFEHGVINLHGGLLPEFGGLYSVNHMLLSGCKIGGGSIHWVDLGIDTGILIKRCFCNIEGEDTAYNLYQKVQVALYDGIVEVLGKGLEVGFDNVLVEENISENTNKQYFGKDSLAGLKMIAFDNINTGEALRTIRAFDFPGYEPAYTIVANSKIYLRIKF